MLPPARKKWTHPMRALNATWNKWMDTAVKSHESFLPQWTAAFTYIWLLALAAIVFLMKGRPIAVCIYLCLVWQKLCYDKILRAKSHIVCLTETMKNSEVEETRDWIHLYRPDQEVSNRISNETFTSICALIFVWRNIFIFYRFVVAKERKPENTNERVIADTIMC
jgi:hypothetical protein